MAINSKESQPSNSTYRFVKAAKGTIDFLGRVHVKASKMHYPFPVSYGTSEALIGSSIAVDEALPAGMTQAGVQGVYGKHGETAAYQPTELPGDNFILWAGEGKVKLTSEAGIEAVKDIGTLPLPLHIAQSSVEMLDGSIGFGSTDAGTDDPYQVGGATVIMSEGDTANMGDNIRGGHGVALVKTGLGSNIVVVDNFVGDGTEDTFVLSEDPIGTTLTSVTINGTATTAYTLTGKEIEFTTAPADAAAIVVTYNAANENADGNFTTKVRLDDLSYPFTLVSGEIIEPLGSAFIYAIKG